MKFHVLILAAVIALAGCASEESSVKYNYPDTSRRNGDFYADPGPGLFGNDGISLFGNDGEKRQGGGSGIAVNSFLWRASLDTVSFMPLVSADPFGGVIITDWYTAPEVEDQRTKVQVYILDRQLRSDGIRVSVFRERRQDGKWVSAEVSPGTVRQIEDSILTRARELRLKSGV